MFNTTNKRKGQAMIPTMIENRNEIEKNKLIKDCIAWSAQQGYYLAEETAKEYGETIGEEMICDQPYYNAYIWRKKENK